MKAPLFLLLSCILFAGSSYAQTPTEKKIYRLVMDSLYNRTATTGAAINDTAYGSVVSGRPHVVLLDRYVVRSTALTGQRRYVDYVEGTWKGTTESQLKNVSTIPFGKEKYCIRIIGNQETVHYDKTKQCTAKQGGKSLPVARYTFSRILYAGNKRTGFLLIRQQWGKDPGSSKLWAITLDKDTAGWQIGKMSYLPE